jgi:uncharacterized protein (TIGR02246 family)
MTNDDRVRTWIDRYVQAWNSNHPDDIAALFTEDAEYRTEPYAAPWRGREQIINQWLANKDEPGDTTFSWSLVAIASERAVIEGTTIYRAARQTFSNLWVIRFADAFRADSFTEWWMEHPRHAEAAV